MPPGPDGFVSDPRYTEEFERAVELLRSTPARWRVIYHYDGDGIASASCALRALARLGYPAQATPLLAVERERMADLLRSTNGPALIVDTGSSWLDLYAAHAHPVIVLDHHRYTPSIPLPQRVALVNPLDWGVDGMDEMCAATLTWLYTIFLDPRNWDNAPWGLSGAIADRQHIGGFHGLNAKLVDEAIERSFVQRHPGLALHGATVLEAIASSIDPFFQGLSGRPEPVRAFLSAHNLPPDRTPASLTPEETERLVTILSDRLEAAHVLPEFVQVLRQDRYELPALGLDAEGLSNRQNACGRAGIPGVGVAIALGDPRALEEGRAAEATWRQGILAGLRRVEEGGLNSMSALQWFESPDTTLAGTQAGLAMNYLVDPERPLFVFSPPGTGPLKVSARGTLRLVGRGLDLASALRIAGTEVGGEGGGHRVASGATIPEGRRDAFLAICDREIAGQLAAHAAGSGPP